jgi:predicted HTH domain antitoxin
MEQSITIEIPNRLLHAARATPDELKVELAVQLYERRRLGIGQARELAGMSLWQFRQLLGSRGIAPHYDVADLDDDMQTWCSLSRLQTNRRVVCQ